MLSVVMLLRALVYGISLLWTLAVAFQPITAQPADVSCVANMDGNLTINGDCVNSVVDFNGSGDGYDVMLYANGATAISQKILNLKFWLCELPLTLETSPNNASIGTFRFYGFYAEDQMLITVEAERLSLNWPKQPNLEYPVECLEPALNKKPGSQFVSQLSVEITSSLDELTKVTAPQLNIELRGNLQITNSTPTSTCEGNVRSAINPPSIFSVTVLLSGSALVLITIMMAGVLFFTCVRHEFDPKSVFKCPHQRDPESVLEKPSVRIGSSTKIKSSTKKEPSSAPVNESEQKPSNTETPMPAESPVAPNSTNNNITAPTSAPKDPPK